MKKKLLVTIIALTAIGVAVRAVKDRNKIVINHEDGSKTILSQKGLIHQL